MKLHKNDRPILPLTLAQVLLCGAGAMILGAWGISVCFVLRELTQNGFVLTGMLAAQLLCGTGAAICALLVAVEMFRVCGRVKTETAFTEVNVRALQRIVLAFAGAAVLLLPVGGALMDLVLWGTFAQVNALWGLLPSFVCGMAALLVRAIVLLLRRAVDMQAENDLTV